MAGLDHTVMFDTSRPKREARPISKKRITFHTKDSNVSQSQQKVNSKSEPKEDKKSQSKASAQSSLAPLDDDADNQGFAEWLRSGDGVDMMRLFVIANSLVVLLTMTWPHIQLTFVMLALLLRGFFLLTVMGWYSTSLWKMIDGYFKGQFQRYLEEEYQRNPKMRQDVRAGFNDAADKSASPVTEELQQVLRSCSAELAAEEVGCTVGEAELAKRSEESGTTPTAADAFAAGAAAEIEEEERDEVEVIVPEAEKEVDGLDELAFREKPARECDAEPPDEEAVILQDTIENESVDNSMVYIEQIEPRQPGLRQDRNEQEYQQQQQQKHRKQHQSQRRSQQQKKEQQRPKPGKKRKFSGRPQIGAKSEKATSKKNRHGPLTLTDEDFERVSRKKYRYTDEEGNIVDRDFSEFDDENSWTSDGFDDEGEEDKRKGIPLADLPYKPAVDVYDLDRLSEEEFCPLTLDDDPTCEETRLWP